MFEATSEGTVDTVDPQIAEIQATYEQLGLAPVGRQMAFAYAESERSQMVFEVVISTTSQPFAR